MEEKERFLVMNGEEKKHYENVSNLILKPNGTIIYKAEKMFKSFVVLNDQEGPSYDYITNLVVSVDGTKLAYRAREKGEEFVVFNGERGKSYEKISDLTLSPDEKQLAYAAKKGWDYVAVVNEQERKEYQMVRDITFSPDSQQLAYIGCYFESGRREGRCVLVVNEKEGNDYFGSIAGPIFSLNSKRIVFTGQREASFVVVNGETQQSYDLVTNIIFSPNGQFVAYIAKKGEKYVTVRDGIESGPYDLISDMQFSPDNRKLAYRAKKGEKYYMVINDQEGKGYGWIYGHYFLFSPDSKRFAYVARETTQAQGEFIVIDEKEGNTYGVVEKIRFSPDSSKISYIVDNKTVVMDEKKLGTYDFVKEIVFSPDSKVVYIAQEELKEFIVVDGHKGPAYEWASGPIVFSSDGKEIAYLGRKTRRDVVVVTNIQTNTSREGSPYLEAREVVFGPLEKQIAYIAQKSGKDWVIVLNNEELQTHEQPLRSFPGYPLGGLTFSPNGQHFAYKVKEKGKEFIVVDENQYVRYDLVSTPIFSTDNQYITYGTRKGNELWWIVEEIE